MPKFATQYKTKQDEIGNWTIYDIPFFKAGTHKGVDYDEKWISSALSRASKLEDEDGYKASVYVGHPEPGKEKAERPSVGLMSKIRQVGDTLYTNITNIPDAVFDIYKNVSYPFRSAEMVSTPDGGIISGLALTSDIPYFKFPALNLKFNEFGDDLNPDVVVYLDNGEAIEMFSALSGSMDDLKKMVQDHIDSTSKGGHEMSEDHKKEETAVDLSAVTTQLDKFNELMSSMNARMDESDKTTKALAETLIAERSAREAEQKDAKNAAVFSYIEDLRLGKADFLKGKAVAPAVLEVAPFIQLNETADVKVTFTEDGVEVEKPVYEAVKQFTEAIISAAVENTLLITPGDVVKKGEDSEVVVPEDKNQESEVNYVERDELINAKMLELAGGEDELKEYKTDFNKLSGLRRDAFIELGIDDD